MALNIQHRVGRSRVNARNNCALFAGGGVEVVREAGIVARAGGGGGCSTHRCSDCDCAGAIGSMRP